jgi:hypothetical protein
MKKDPPIRVPLSFEQLVDGVLKVDVSKLPKSARPGRRKKAAKKKKK